MPQSSLIQVRLDEELKKDADALFADLGFDTPTAIRIFLKRAVKQQGMPFAVGQPIPNAETAAAMEEGERVLQDRNAKRYANLSELLAEAEHEV